MTQERYALSRFRVDREAFEYPASDADKNPAVFELAFKRTLN